VLQIDAETVAPAAEDVARPYAPSMPRCRGRDRPYSRPLPTGAAGLLW
jgi:hypothetical protein